jgi:hypothetical protein
MKKLVSLLVMKNFILLFAAISIFPACRNDECSRSYSPRPIYVENGNFDPEYLVHGKGCNQNLFLGMPEPSQTTSSYANFLEKPSYHIEIGLMCHCGEVLEKTIWGNEFEKVGTYLWKSQKMYSYDSMAGAWVKSGFYRTSCGIPLPGLCPRSENCIQATPPEPDNVHNYHIMDATTSYYIPGISGGTIVIDWVKGFTFCCHRV